MTFTFSRLVLPWGAGEDAGQAVVALVAGGVEDHVALVGGVAHLDENSPRLGILEGDLADRSCRRPGVKSKKDRIAPALLLLVRSNANGLLRRHVDQGAGISVFQQP